MSHRRSVLCILWVIIQFSIICIVAKNILTTLPLATRFKKGYEENNTLEFPPLKLYRIHPKKFDSSVLHFSIQYGT